VKNDLESRYRAIQAQIKETSKSAGRFDSPTLIAVSKFQPVEAIRALYDLGHRDFGENYVQELLQKAETFKEQGITDIRWHFIGHLQSNKVKQLLPYVASIHSVDSLKLTQEISKRWIAIQTAEPGASPSAEVQPLSVFLTVNIDQEESKSGVHSNDARSIAESISKLPGLRLEGLMCIPAPATTSQSTAFARLRALEQACRPYTHGQLSMGMSDDFPEAIREGSTHLRVGTSLFGKRDLVPFG
jgi:pyridoxal phosphate enzyme (YggS family)